MGPDLGAPSLSGLVLQGPRSLVSLPFFMGLAHTPCSLFGLSPAPTRLGLSLWVWPGPEQKGCLSTGRGGRAWQETDAHRSHWETEAWVEALEAGCVCVWFVFYLGS